MMVYANLAAYYLIKWMFDEKKKNKFLHHENTRLKED